jgi:hypothetical protein
MTAELIDPATGEIISLDPSAARSRAGMIRAGLDEMWVLITEAYAARDWLALGYPTWDAYCDAEFRGRRLALPREERAAVVGSLRDAGMSTRAIATATGISEATVRRELPRASNDAVEPARPITGVNGKAYQPTRPESAPPRHLHPVAPQPQFTDARTVSTQLLDKICRLAELPDRQQREHAAAWARQIYADDTTLPRLDGAITYLTLLREELAR